MYEPTMPRPHNDRADERQHSACHVHNTGSGKVDHAWANLGRVGVELGEEAFTRPHPVYNNGVDETTDEEGVRKVRPELCTFRNSSTYDGSSSCSKSELKEPKGKVLQVGKEKSGPSNERVRSAVCNSVSNDPEAQASNSCIHNVLEEDILSVFRTDSASLEHTKASLHEENQKGAKQHPQQRIRGVGDSVRFYHVGSFCPTRNGLQVLKLIKESLKGR
mmetsp:Transcript_10495/g.27476  ORF Transcript_10495/g.27476 Transcript_10495/m.27476 type:complete len:219 (-) Transcript_10495:129-785(-)